MIDLHTHILPGVDDGVRTEDDAVEFARVAQADGIRTIVATPHCKEPTWANERTGILDRVARLSERLRAEGVEIELLPGAEVHICPDLPERVRDGRATTLADNGKTLLLELSLDQYPAELENLVFQLQLSGLVVVFAHPERIRYFQDEISHFEAVVRQGAYGQLTTGSVLGQFGRVTKEFSQELLRKGLVHVLASDSHNVKGRAPKLAEAVRATAALVGEERARSMVESIPAALIAGRAPELPTPERRTSGGRSFLGRLFRRG